MTTTTTITTKSNANANAKSESAREEKNREKNHYYCMTKVTKTDTIRCIASENRRCRNSFIQTHTHTIFVCLCFIFYSVFYGDRSCLFHSLHLCSIVVLYTPSAHSLSLSRLPPSHALSFFVPFSAFFHCYCSVVVVVVVVVVTAT